MMPVYFVCMTDEAYHGRNWRGKCDNILLQISITLVPLDGLPIGCKAGTHVTFLIMKFKVVNIGWPDLVVFRLTNLSYLIGDE